MSRRTRINPGVRAAVSGALAAVAVMTLAVVTLAVGALAASAGASTSTARGLGFAAPRGAPAVHALSLHAMPVGTVTFGWGRHGRLTVHADMFGLTPGSSHNVILVIPGWLRAVRFSTLTANSVGQANATLHSGFTGRVPRGSRLLVLMGVGGHGIAREPIARTKRLRHPGRRPHRLISVEVGSGWSSFGTPRGRATISYNAQRLTLTVTVHASGLTPGPHAAHIHLGSCMSQGPVLYMLKDLIANTRGRIAHAVRVFTNVTAPIPAHGWYLNIHQGNSSNILSNGQPTIFFRPLLCANIIGSGSISSILRTGDITTGVRGTSDRKVVLTGSAATGNGAQTFPFLYRGLLTGAAAGAAVSVLTPSFRGVTSATFYGPDTHSFNPTAIPRGQVRAVGSYESSSAPAGVGNQGMIYLGPVSGLGGSWTSIDVPADGTHTVGHVRACPRIRAHCFVMDTIAHSTMGDLVVGNYDLNPIPGRVISGNGFIYNLRRHEWTLLRLGGSLSSKTSLYGIWQDGGDRSSRYTLAGGSAASGARRAFLMNYNERTGRFGRPKYFSYGNAPTRFTHFDGITAVPGGFNLVAVSSAQDASLAFVPVGARNGFFGTARWHPVNVAASPLCADGCVLVTGNAVYENHVMGLYIPTSSGAPHTYLATIW